MKEMPHLKHIGIVGGVGPFTGVDIVKKIMDLTIAFSDKEHIPITLISEPHRIEDRSDFILGKTKVNPAYEVSKIIEKLEKAEATVVGIPCNTIHFPKIFNVILSECKKKHLNIKIINMIDEVINTILNFQNSPKRIGVLGTSGTYKSNLYKNALELAKLQCINVSESTQEKVHDAIYNKKYGLKSIVSPPSNIALLELHKAADQLIENGAEVIIIGCTELVYAFKLPKYKNTPLIESTTELAKALIRYVDVYKLKTFN